MPLAKNVQNVFKQEQLLPKKLGPFDCGQFYFLIFIVFMLEVVFLTVIIRLILSSQLNLHWTSQLELSMAIFAYGQWTARKQKFF